MYLNFELCIGKLLKVRLVFFLEFCGKLRDQASCGQRHSKLDLGSGLQQKNSVAGAW